MVHDPDLLDRLEAWPRVSFDGEVFRATRLSLDPLAGSYNGGRWMSPDAAAILYTSLERDGALAEIAFHWSRLNPQPTKPVVVHRLRVEARRALRLIRADLPRLGIPESAYGAVNLARTQEIGAAVEFLGCDGLIAPSARWSCDNLMLFPERLAHDAKLEVVRSEIVDWIKWAEEAGLVAKD